ncbi:hypothetical protein [Paenibacillus xylanexedens]|uniref:hypothetical protein n=1 Tax=Paenibacillus xylanexedens TaxID=528191 RepID=UPI001C92C752|nr:hypothetical protein [Paenibacillus xylanexedens]
MSCRCVFLAADPIIPFYRLFPLALTVIRTDKVYLLTPSQRLKVGFLRETPPDNPTKPFLMMFI